MPRKVFTAGEVLAAADVNSFLMDQTIQVFAGTAARGSAIGTATEGMYTHLNDTDALQYWNGSAWVSAIPASTSAVLQVLSTTKTDTFTLNSTTFTEITGLTRTITPSSATSKVLVNVSVASSSDSNTLAHFFRLMRGATAIGVGDSAGSRIQASTVRLAMPNATLGAASNFQFLDSPSSTSALTYSVQVRGENASLVAINRGSTDTDNNTYARAISTITVMEIAG